MILTPDAVEQMKNSESSYTYADSLYNENEKVTLEHKEASAAAADSLIDELQEAHKFMNQITTICRNEINGYTLVTTYIPAHNDHDACYETAIWHKSLETIAIVARFSTDKGMGKARDKAIAAHNKGLAQLFDSDIYKAYDIDECENVLIRRDTLSL